MTLAGTLTLPPGRGPFPAVMMITGSEAQDRDETILGHKPFFVIADALTGEASRCCGSTIAVSAAHPARPVQLDVEDFAGDVLAESPS